MIFSPNGTVERILPLVGITGLACISRNGAYTACHCGIASFFDQFGGANVCFIITFLFIFAKIAHVAIISPDSFLQRAVFTFFLFGVFGVGLVETIRGVNNWAANHRNPQTAHEVVEAKPDVPEAKSKPAVEVPPIERPKKSVPPVDQAFHEKLPEIVHFSLGEHGLTVGASLKSLTEEKSTRINMGGFVPVKFHLENGVIYCDVTIW